MRKTKSLKKVKTVTRFKFRIEINLGALSSARHDPNENSMSFKSTINTRSKWFSDWQLSPLASENIIIGLTFILLSLYASCSYFCCVNDITFYFLLYLIIITFFISHIEDLSRRVAFCLVWKRNPRNPGKWLILFKTCIIREIITAEHRIAKILTWSNYYFRKFVKMYKIFHRQQYQSDRSRYQLNVV